MSRHRVTTVLGAWAVLAACCASAPAEGPQTTFLKTYGRSMKKALATPTTDDDLFLAEKLLADADAQPGDVAALLYRKAYELAEPTPNGYDLGVEAMESLYELDPAQKESCLEHIFLLRKKQYDQVGGRQRTDVGGDIIDVLIDLADIKAAQGKKHDAEMFLRQAMTTAHATRSRRRREIQDRLQQLPETAAVGGKRRTLRSLLQSDPNDVPVRSDLIRLYLVHDDDPAAAEALLSPDLNETLRSYVPLLRRDPNTLPPEVADEMARWLTSLANSAPKDRRADLLYRAKKFLDRVLAGFDVNDDRRKEAAERFRALDNQLASLGATVGGRRWSLNPSQLGLVATPDVNRAIHRAREFLLRRQQSDGSWRPAHPNPPALDRTSATALVAYALLQSGVSVRDPRLRKSLSLLRNEETNNTQALAFRCFLWARCRRELGRRYERRLRKDAEQLYRSSGNGGLEATADPTQPARRGDAYHTQWAVLALATAEAEGVAVPRTFWNLNRAWWRRSQNEDGGWGRRMGRLSRPFYTAAGAVSLLIDFEGLGQRRSVALKDRTVLRALAWVDQNFDAVEARDRELFYFTLARLGVARGETKIGAKNWYVWIARDLFHTQQRDGAWRPRRENVLFSTALNILTLSFARGGRSHRLIP